MTDDDDMPAAACSCDQDQDQDARPFATRPPRLQRPIYLSGAMPPDVLRVCRDNGPRLAGLVGATLLGVTAAYFAPKFFDRLLAGVGHPDDVELDLEDDDTP